MREARGKKVLPGGFPEGPGGGSVPLAKVP